MGQDESYRYVTSVLFIALGIATGWFLRSSVDAAIQGKDWRTPLRWAAIAAVDILAVLVISRYLT